MNTIDQHHTTTRERSGNAHRSTCTCGWLGRWRRGADAGWRAMGDGDDHLRFVGAFAA